MPGLLGVHLIGSGYGESIILELPNGKFGVIDCCCSRLDAESPQDRLDVNPTVRFLHSTLEAQALAFVAFTHPHEDHGRGLSHVLEHYQGRIDEIWIFESLHDIHLIRYFKALIVNHRRLDLEIALSEAPGTFSLELMKTRALVQKETQTRRRHVELRKFQGYQVFDVPDEPIRFHFLGPSAGSVDAYQSRLSESLADIVDPHTCKANGNWDPRKLNHNLLSPAFLLTYGRTQVVLGGDMEKDAWQRVMEERRTAAGLRPDLVCQLLKTSHHGSVTGYCADLYERFSRKGRFLAVMTPFNRGSRPLPQVEGVKYLHDHSGDVLVTNLDQARKCLGYRYSTSRPVPHLDSRWHSLLRNHPEWVGVLDASLVEGPDVSILENVPPELLAVIRSSPELAEALRPGLVDSMPRPLDDARADNDCRISVFFNEHGNEVKKRRIIGRRAGVL